MIIDRVTFKNYRQFRDTEISFPNRSDKNLHVIVGKNTAGKTNILNAINWCLYDKEPHLSGQSTDKPLLNLKTIENSKKGEEHSVEIEIWVTGDNNQQILFRRSKSFKVYSKNSLPVPQKTNFEVSYYTELGNNITEKGSDAEEYVERFVPEKIREYFFFDGERLDDYIVEEKTQFISNAIFTISRIEVLNRIAERLEKTAIELRRQKGRLNPNLESKLSQKLENKANELKEIQDNIYETKYQIKKAKMKMEEYSEKLRGKPDVTELELRRIELKELAEKKEKYKIKKIKEKRDLLLKFGSNLMLYNAIENALIIIKEKEANNEIPVVTDENLLKNTIKTNICDLCGKEIDEKSRERVLGLIDDIKLSSDIGNQLISMKSPLNILKSQLSNFKTMLFDIKSEIENYDEDLQRIHDEIEKIDIKQGGFNKEQVKQWSKQRSKFEELYEKDRTELGRLIEREENTKKEITKLEKSLNKSIEDKKALENIQKFKEFAEESLSATNQIKDSITNETREKIRVETNKLFFKFNWRKKTYKEVVIDEFYNVDVIDILGFSCRGSLSAAEEELLVLAFTLAIHKISGFDSPLIIDTPVAKVSDENRENFGAVLSDISHDKETILIFSPSEYSEEIKKLIDTSYSNKYEIKVSSDEKEALLEALK